MKITLDQAEQLVQLGKNVKWNGWELMIIDPRIDGFSRLDGIFHNGRWCVKSTIAPNREGLYFVNKKYYKLISGLGD